MITDAQRRYNASAKGKAARAKYAKTRKGKIVQAKSSVKYWESLGYAAQARSAQRWLDGLIHSTTSLNM